MSEIIELIKVVRERTGAGLMDCKNALKESDNDVEKACTWLREKGIAKAAKKSTRIAAEGLTAVKVNGNKAILVEVNCETDFVAKSDPFIELTNTVADTVLNQDLACVNCAKEATAELFTDATVKLGEKLDLRRIEVVNKEDSDIFGQYVHMKGKISVLVQLAGGTPEIAKGIAMTIAANNPQYATKDDISKEEIEKEYNIQVETAKEDHSLDGKPDNIKEKILQGRVDKHFKEMILVDQEYVLDPSITVGDLLKMNGASIKKFVRYQVGEGMEKRVDDFAAEVMNQAK